MNKDLSGIWTALVSPFDSEQKLDLKAYRKILKHQIEGGVTGVIPCGTTGETPALTLDERKQLIQIALEETKGTEVQVIAGTGSNSTQSTVEFSKWASDQGVNGLLIVTPYYNKPSQRGLEAHYLAIANAVDCPIMLYNVPGRTACTLSPQTIGKLSTHEKIVAIKEATPNPMLTTPEILNEVNTHQGSLQVLSGDDPTFLALLSVGGVGHVSVASNLIPSVIVEIYKAASRNDFEAARALNQKYSKLFQHLFIDTNPVPIKYAMKFGGFCSDQTRLPLVGLTEDHQKRLDQVLKECEVPSC